MIRISVSRADATVLETETLTAGRIGLVCEFVFSSDWDDLEKVAVFDGEVTREVMLDENNRAIVPAECMATAGYKLRCGVTGLNAEQVVVLPTVYVNAGKIRESAEIADSSIEEITPSLASQVISRANEALRVANELASDAESGRFDGEDGVSPTLNVTTITNGHRVSITDRDGTDEFDVMNGVNGEDGDSPTIAVTDITGGHVLTITDANGTRTVNVLNGADGADGATGATGADGYSPTVTVTDITGGHRVTITDANGTHSFDVMDGEDGSGGGSSPDIYGGSNVIITYWTDGTQTEACSVAKSDVPGAVVGDFIIGKHYGELSIMKTVRENTGMLFGDETIAIDSATIPTKTSDLTNDSGFVDASGAASAAPVQSVNGQTGAVTISVPAAATTAPANLGASASVGNGTTWARSNHVHKRPTAAEVGAIPAPSSPTSGQFLVYNGSAWVAQTVPSASGVNF